MRTRFMISRISRDFYRVIYPSGWRCIGFTDFFQFQEKQNYSDIRTVNLFIFTIYASIFCTLSARLKPSLFGANLAFSKNRPLFMRPPSVGPCWKVNAMFLKKQILVNFIMNRFGRWIVVRKMWWPRQKFEWKKVLTPLKMSPKTRS